MDSSIYLIHSDWTKYGIKKALSDHELNLSKHVVNNICEAIDSGLDYVELANIITPYNVIKLKSSKQYFKDTLEENLNILINYEEYEVCANAKKYIDILNNKLLTL